ncbi:hypothetical protein PROFUN_02024 [Planoprotostelium fungivorum]|uniref:HotDog ACOT-type domain-containing protein n=1 Tax=Planoprotostelium fungivorum TaxID=1890364 RepID=A0A2P6NB66_9EUKA|nr:hypothetical protein PROFUN_02024 [Planoprotostelium fungivorum]
MLSSSLLAATPQTPNWKIHRTGITALLWGQRQLEIQKQRLNETKGLIVPHVLTPKKPSDSIVEISLPFGSNSELRDQYLSPFGHIRIGRLLEDLDAMAGNIAFLHADDGNPGSAPLVIVTASLDRIHLHRPLMPDQDLVLRGQVTWVGRSSMEIEISANSTHDNAPSIVAVFTMVATDPMTKKSTQVNPLEPVTEEEKKRFDLGERNRQNSLANEPPTVDERLVLHRVFMEWNKKVDNADYVTMSSTARQSVILCQPSERNFANKIFGGYLMRSGFELAFSTAYLFCKTRPSFEAMDDTTFHRPVEIGSILCLKAQVVYSKEGHVMVQVRAHVTDPKIGKEELTNVFNFTFKCEQPEQGAGALRRVYPESYAEAMAFLEGRRLFHQHQTSCQ